MRTLRHLAGLLLIILAVAPSAAMGSKHANGYAKCASSRGDFSTLCPSSWHRFDWFGDSISLLSFPPSQREHGAIIKADGAQIIVSKEVLDGISFTDWVKQDNRNMRFLSESSGRPLTRNKACQMQAYAEVADGSSPSEIDGQFYCMVGKSVFKLWMRSWANDPHRPEYKVILATMFAHFKTHP
jgi:hypothetical protein